MALLRRLWPRDHRTASAMESVLWARVGRRRRALPRSAKPAAKFVKVHCVAGHGRMDASVIPRTAERVPWNYRCFVPNGFRSKIEGRCGERCSTDRQSRSTVARAIYAIILAIKRVKRNNRDDSM